MPFGAVSRGQNTGGVSDPFAPMHSMAQTIGALNQIRNQNAEYAARQRAGEIWATSKDPNDAMARLQQDPLAMGFAPQNLTLAREAYATQMQAAHTQLQINDDALTMGLKFMPLAVTDPSRWEDVKRIVANTTPDTPMKASTLDAFNALGESQSANMPSDPQEAAATQFRRQSGLLYTAGVHGDDLKYFMGQPDMLKTSDGSTFPIWRGGVMTGPGTVTPTGPGYGPGLGPSIQMVGGVPTYVQGQEPGLVPPPGMMFPPGGPYAPTAPAPAPAVGASDYAPGAVETEALPPPAAAAPPTGGAPSAAAPGPGTGATGALPPGSEGAPSATGSPPATPGVVVPPTTAAPPTAVPAQVPSGQVPQAQINWPQIMKAKLTEKAADHFDTQYSEISGRVDAGRQLMQGIDEMRNLMQQVQLGPQQAWRYPTAQTLQQMGVPDAIVRQVQGGDPGAAQELQKFFVTTTMGQLRAQLPAGSRLNLQEWAAFVKNNPGLETRPDAIERIFNFWTRQFQMNTEELREYPEYVNRGGSPYNWDAEWTRRAQQQGFFHPQAVTGQARGTTRQPAAPAPGTPPPSMNDILNRHIGG